jgi:hypothetical protein
LLGRRVRFIFVFCFVLLVFFRFFVRRLLLFDVFSRRGAEESVLERINSLTLAAGRGCVLFVVVI